MTLKLTNEWDKVFPESDKVNRRKVTFKNHFGIELAADLYEPKTQTNRHDKLPAIAICGPYGAVKEQSSGLYAQEMAERGFITLAFDPSFTGETKTKGVTPKPYTGVYPLGSTKVGNKELYIVEGASHVDLYDQKDKIPFDKIETFLKEALAI